MGIGVYENDFYGTGETFIVSPDHYNTQDEYESYVSSFAGDDEDEPLDFDEWARQNDDDYFENMKYAIQGALGRIGTGFHASNPRDRESFGADREFELLFRGWELDVGVRGWESDYIVAIAPTREHVRSLISDGEQYDGECESEFETTLDELRSEYASAVSSLTQVIIQSLVGEGLDCRYRTSGYSTAGYTTDVSFDLEAHARTVRREPESAPAP